MRRSEDRILTTHVGSLVRPPYLLSANDDSHDDAGSANRHAKLKMAVTEVLEKQLATGLDIVNDGEFGKSGWSSYALERLDGFEVRPNSPNPLDWLGRDRERFADFFAEEIPDAFGNMEGEACVGPISYTGLEALQESLELLREAADAADHRDVFMTAVAPASTAYNGIDEYYKSEHDYVFAIADAMRHEYRAIHDAGFVVQVDDAVLANMYDSLVAQAPQKYRDWAQLRVDALNHALSDIPTESVRYHICFGSWHVPHVADAPLEELIDLIMQVDAQAYLIEAANVRHEHEWRVWEQNKLADGKILVPGVITHHTTTVEHPRLVADRIVRFAKLVGRENVIAGTDCGFAQSEWVRRAHPSVMWAKLEALVEGARIASAELWC
jgi:5-methyltetrahydropteroyltriglutamate--homocysteine methyltransferase